MGDWYRRNEDNAEIFGSKRFKYYFDLRVSPDVCKWWHGDGHEDTGWVHPDVEKFCETITGQTAWNDHTRFARWGWLGVNLDCGDKMCVLPYITSHLRFAFVRKHDAALFKLRYFSEEAQGYREYPFKSDGEEQGETGELPASSPAISQVLPVQGGAHTFTL